MILFFDFPAQVVESGVFMGPRCESLREVMPRVNQWVGQNRVRVLNIETLLLPGLIDEPVIADATSLPSFGNATTHWRQVIRVWYEKA
jgi:hypothetical protein